MRTLLGLTLVISWPTFAASLRTSTHTHTPALKETVIHFHNHLAHSPNDLIHNVLYWTFFPSLEPHSSSSDINLPVSVYAQISMAYLILYNHIPRCFTDITFYVSSYKVVPLTVAVLSCIIKLLLSIRQHCCISVHFVPMAHIIIRALHPYPARVYLQSWELYWMARCWLQHIGWGNVLTVPPCTVSHRVQGHAALRESLSPFQCAVLSHHAS